MTPAMPEILPMEDTDADALPLVDVIFESGGWDEEALAALADRAARAALSETGIAPEGFQIALLAADDARIADLNAGFRGRAQPTNVLSWPSEERAADRPGTVPHLPEPGPPDDPESLGDIALAYETCEGEAALAGKPFADHLSHLIVHGVLHLLGYDHVDDADATLMEATEVRALARMGIGNPY